MGSKYNNNYCTKTGKTYAEMFDEEKYNYLIENKGTPEDIRILYATSAFEVGFNIEDEDFQVVVIEAYTPQQVLQFFGRIRHDVEKLIIVQPHGQERMLDLSAELADRATACEHSQEELEKIYEE